MVVYLPLFHTFYLHHVHSSFTWSVFVLTVNCSFVLGFLYMFYGGSLFGCMFVVVHSSCF